MSSGFTQTVSTRINEEMYHAINQMAEDEQRPLANMVRVLLTEALEYRAAGVSMKDWHGLQEGRNLKAQARHEGMKKAPKAGE